MKLLGQIQMTSVFLQKLNGEVEKYSDRKAAYLPCDSTTIISSFLHTTSCISFNFHSHLKKKKEKDDRLITALDIVTSPRFICNT